MQLLQDGYQLQLQNRGLVLSKLHESQAGELDPPGEPIPFLQRCWLIGVDWLNHGQKESALHGRDSVDGRDTAGGRATAV